MQHLSPSNARRYPELVLRLQSHPNRWLQAYDSEAQGHRHHYVQNNDTSDVPIGIDYQRVYLCLLREVLGDVISDFTYEHPNGYIILTTANLHETLKLWALKISALHLTGALVELQRIEAALQNVVSILRVNNEKLNITTDLSDDGWQLATWCMVETLDQARLSVLATVDRLRPHRPVDCRARVKTLETTMIGRGWCPNHIKMCREAFGTSSLYYASLLPRSMPRSHDACLPNNCLAYSRVHRSPITAHLPESCDCKHLVTPTGPLLSIVQAGLIPLVYAETLGDEVMAISIVPYHAGQTFVALSHVWCHGLGNATGNSLRQCQIRRILQFVTPHTEPPFLFWLDTLCIPREPYPLRRKAIEGIRRVYEVASTVLALDEELVVTSVSGMGYEEILMRVHLSGWMRRLWTLHEQSRANNVYFQFADGVYGQNELIENFENDVHAHQKVGIPFHKVVPTRGMSLLEKLSRIKSGRHLPTTLVELWGLLRWRHLSWPEDETICMANILGLSPRVVDGLLHTPYELRMQKFLELFTHYPAALLFLQTEKLRTSGCGWAPVSWVHCVQHLDELLNVRVCDDFLGMRIERGLIVSCSAITFTANGHKTNLDGGRSFLLSLPNMNTCFLVTVEGPNPPTNLDLTHRYLAQSAICLENDLPSKHVRAVLVATAETTTFDHRQVTYAQFLLNLQIQEIPSPTIDLSGKTKSATPKHANLKTISGEYSSPKYWCIG